MGKIYQVVVHGIRGEKKTIDLCNTEEQMKSLTVKQLKGKIAERIPETAGKPVRGLKFTLYSDWYTDETAMRLIFADKMLEEDSDLLSSYGIQHMSILQMVIRLPGGLLF
ncbi:unnamed protein product [Tetraodon nigroviridis]|uniref:(spotted green pufferfish) hypothetical protein n=1 Tax=Tetraodon nigroviridis TaxID=99883 RepID=Q4S432_TETNG|nr:unnamed protein product [Tetraodon nigroviridis]